MSTHVDMDSFLGEVVQLPEGMRQDWWGVLSLSQESRLPILPPPTIWAQLSARVDLWMAAWGRFRFHRGKQSCGNHFQFPIPYSLLPDEGGLGEARQPGSQAWGQRLAWEAPARCTLSPHEPHKRPTHKHGHTRPGSLSERAMFFLQGPPSSRASGQQGCVGRGPGDRGRDRAGVGLPIFCSQSHRGGGCWPGSGADKPVG